MRGALSPLHPNVVRQRASSSKLQELPSHERPAASPSRDPPTPTPSSLSSPPAERFRALPPGIFASPFDGEEEHLGFLSPAVPERHSGLTPMLARLDIAERAAASPPSLRASRAKSSQQSTQQRRLRLAVAVAAVSVIMLSSAALFFTGPSSAPHSVPATPSPSSQSSNIAKNADEEAIDGTVVLEAIGAVALHEEPDSEGRTEPTPERLEPATAAAPTGCAHPSGCS